MVNYIKAAIDLGRPVVKAVGEAFDALGNKIGALPDAITAYHGSPHDFDEFDMGKIGTGEGAQAYGHGLYFAESEDVARGYRDALSKQVTLDGKPMLSHPSDGPVGQAENSIARAVSNGEDPASAISREAKEWRDAAQSYRDAGVGQTPDVARSAEQTARSFEDVANAIEAQDPSRFVKNTGSMYEVNIDATADDFLDWDKPLSEQPESFIDIVKNADFTGLPEGGRLRRTIEAWRKNEGDWVPEIGANIPEPTVNQIYNALTDFGADPTRNVNFSNELKNSGVKGIKYLDQNSRGVGAGTRNYVVFDDKLVSIVRKYGIAGAATIYGVSEADIANALQEGEQ
jgi:hypothetical protein